MAQSVAGGVVRPFVEIDAADVFAPADDLADEPLGGVDRHVPGSPCVFRGLADLHRIEQADVDRGGEVRVPQVALPLHHRILVIAELRQGVFDEMRQRPAGLSRVGGKGEGAERAEVVGKAGLDKIEHLFDRLVRREPHGRGVDLARGGFAVVVVVVPLVAGGLVAVHHQAGLASHLAIEILHPQRLAPLGPVLEILVGGDEAVVLKLRDLERRVVQSGDQPPFAGFCRQHLPRTVLVGAAQELTGDAAGVVGVVELGIGDVPAVVPEAAGELAHGGENQGDLLGMVADIGRLVRDLGHDDHVPVLVRLAERGDGFGQLVAQDQDESGHQGISFPA